MNEPTEPPPCNPAAWPAKLERLRALDRGFAVFGSQFHRHLLRPPATAHALAATESRLGVTLPEPLRTYYRTVADGGAGPGFGILPLDRLVGRSPAVAFPGVEALRALARAQDDEDDEHDADDEDDEDDDAESTGNDERAYFEVPAAHITGLVACVEHGCGHQSAMVTAGPRVGTLVEVSNDGYVVELHHGFEAELHRWVDAELARFDDLFACVDAGLGHVETVTQLLARGGFGWSPDDYAVSAAGLDKPAALFGRGSYRIYGGAGQAEFYRAAFATLQAQRSAR